MEQQIKEAVESANNIVIIQADNPDADSLGSALALEEILGDLGKTVHLYCGVNVPEYLRYLEGWDRVVNEIPKSFDISIIVDASTYTLLQKLQDSGQIAWVKAKPCVVIDHHATVEKLLDFSNLQLNRPDLSSTGEIILHLSKSFDWQINDRAADYLMTAVLGDTQGLTNDLTKSTTYIAMAEMTDLGANRPKLEELRREASKMPEIIYRYKSELIKRTEINCQNKLAIVTIPQSELNNYSPLYNPAPLIQNDMLQIKGVAIAIVVKCYDDGRITGSLRSNNGYPFCGKLAEALGGGGHDHASGFKITDGRGWSEIKETLLEMAEASLNPIYGDIA